MAESDGQWIALAADRAFHQTSVGFNNASDGVTDLADGFNLKWHFTSATRGNIVLIGELEIPEEPEFTIAIAFGKTRHSAITTLLQSLSTPFKKHHERFADQWKSAITSRKSLEHCSTDKGNLFRASYSLLLAHEDKTYAGAQIASLSIPWGEARNDKDGEGGYHLVWTRDLVQSATALLAAGQSETPRRTLIYLAVAQLANGSFSQNFWVDGRPFRDGTQLDEVAFPIMLARRLHVEGVCGGFDPSDMVQRATRYLILHGPITEQERWEESSGYSPSTLASLITATLCAASFCKEKEDDIGTAFLEDYADWMRSHLVDWTVTTAGTLVDGIKEHFVRLNPAKPGQVFKGGSSDRAELKLTSQPPGGKECFPAPEVVDAGFLELVRHGILAADDPLVIDSLRVVDQRLKIQTPNGACWRRYNHDGYGQRDDGSAFNKYGVGRAWPLLCGERGHFELLAGNDPTPMVTAMEKFADRPGLLPEQIWDVADLPAAEMRCGFASGSARPLLWAHSEYIKLLRSIDDGVPYDRFNAVADRYLDQPGRCPPEFWTFNHPTPSIPAGRSLRICCDTPFVLHFTVDGWSSVSDVASRQIYGIDVVEVKATEGARSIDFTMLWKDVNRWEGRNFEVVIR